MYNIHEHLVVHSANGYILYIYICSTPVVVVMQYAHYGVYSVPQSECVGWYKWTPANTAVHNLRNGMYLSLLSTKA